jgi:2'-5' RNA ligase
VNAAETEQANQYNKGSRKKVLLPLPDTIDPTTKEFDAYQRKVNRWMADDDMGFVALPRVDGALPISIEPDQMAYQTASEYGKNIMALSGTPSVAVGLSDNHTYGAIAAGLGAWTQLSVQPTLDLLADEDTATMRKEEGEAFTIAYEATKVADPEIELQETDQDIQAGTITVGELRKQRGRKPFGDERDDMIAGGEAIKAWGAPKEEPPADGVPAESGKGEAPAPPATSARDAIIQKQQRPMEALPNQTKSMFRSTEMVPLTGENRPPVIAFDLDGTLANKLDVYQPGLIGEPNKKMVDLARMVRAAGCNVVVYTARNEDRAVARWLDDAGVPWCGINENPYVGQAKDGAKMLFDVLVDDRVTDARTMEAIVMQGIAGHLEPSWRNKLLDQFNRSTASDSYGFLFAPIGGQLAGKIRKIQDEIEPSHLAGSGIENELHVTILYGMVGEDESDIPKVFSQVSSPQFRLRKKLTAFDGQNGSTALVIELDGEDLHGVNAVASKAFAHVKTHPTYRPHITVAYVDSDHASKYENVKVTGASSKVETLVYRSQRGPDLVVPLRG